MNPDQQKQLEELLDQDCVSLKNYDESTLQLIVKAISVMNIKQLKVLTKEYLSKDDRKDFLKLIRRKFSECKEKNDTYLTSQIGMCDGITCWHYGIRGYQFTGNESKNSFNLLFEIEAGICQNVCSCTVFEVGEVFIGPFKTKRRKENRENRENNDSEFDDMPF